MQGNNRVPIERIMWVLIFIATVAAAASFASSGKAMASQEQQPLTYPRFEVVAGEEIGSLFLIDHAGGKVYGYIQDTKSRRREKKPESIWMEVPLRSAPLEKQK